jgi:uncharacterized protein YjbI with pentapeptide repeats
MKAIEESQIVLLLLSQTAVAKTGFVQKEIREAIEKAKQYPPDRIVLIPIRLDDCQPSYQELRDLQWVDLFPKRASGLFKLVETLIDLEGKSFPQILSRMALSIDKSKKEEQIRTREDFLEKLRTKTDFSATNLMHVNLSYLDLSQASFAGANLVGANMSGTNLTEADFAWANLEGVNLKKSNLSHTRFLNTNLWGAKIELATGKQFGVNPGGETRS